jgi:hypothetical protein
VADRISAEHRRGAATECAAPEVIYITAPNCYEIASTRREKRNSVM